MPNVAHYNTPAAPQVGTEWMADAACLDHDPELWWPDNEVYQGEAVAAQTSAAKSVCDTCPVIDECYAYATAIRADHGIWAGMTSPERRKARKLDPVLAKVCPVCELTFAAGPASIYCSDPCKRMADRRRRMEASQP